MSAVISECGKYRYRLDRRVADAGKVYAFIGVNPSTADASVDDATVRKWRGFVSLWGGSRFIVGNVFAYRSTDVKALADALDPVGRENTSYLSQIVTEADVVIPCWGSRDKLPRHLRHHLGRVLDVFDILDIKPMAFGHSKSGDPIHPLMLGYATPLIPLKRRTSVGAES